VEEGLSNSEDACVGATTEFAKVNLNVSQGAVSQTSGQKRKRTIGVEKKGKKKATLSLAIAETVKEIAETCKSRNETISNASVGEVMTEISLMDEVTCDLEFHTLCCQLMMFKSSKRMTIEEMVAMFLVIVGHGIGNIMILKRFQHSGETVSRHVHRVLHACLKLSYKYIKLEDPMLHDCHAKVKNDQCYWPFFKNATRAIDGTHVSCVVSASDQTRFIERK
jgi:hypothetical protein